MKIMKYFSNDLIQSKQNHKYNSGNIKFDGILNNGNNEQYVKLRSLQRFLIDEI